MAHPESLCFCHERTKAGTALPSCDVAQICPYTDYSFQVNSCSAVLKNMLRLSALQILRENNIVYVSYKYVGGGSGQAQNFHALQQAVIIFYSYVYCSASLNIYTLQPSD